MPISPDLGRIIADVTEIAAEKGGLFRMDFRPSIDRFLRGESKVSTGEIIVGVSLVQMLNMGYSPDEVYRVLEAGFAELTQAKVESGGL